MSVGEVIDYSRDKVSNKSRGFQFISLDNRTYSSVVVLYPGESVSYTIFLSGGCYISLGLRYNSKFIDVRVEPINDSAQLAVKLKISAAPSAPSGVYPVRVRVLDKRSGILLSSIVLQVLIIDKKLDKSIARHIRSMINITRKLGMQGLFWYTTTFIYPYGASFSQIHAIHCLVSRRKVSAGTTGNILGYMVKKGILERDGRGLYKSKIKDIRILYTRIDSSRIRIQTRTNRNIKNSSEQSLFDTRVNKIPRNITLVFNRALKIMNKHGSLAAMYFLAYTLVGARKTGFLVLWKDNMFVYCERKTGFCHHFTSQLLSNYFKILGLHDGVMYSNTREHRMARKIAEKYIKKYYKGFRMARRLHYTLKQHNLIHYNNEIYMIDILYYDNGIGVRVWNENKDKLLIEENIQDKKPRHVESRTVYSYEHIYEPNEDTYFHGTP